MLLVIACSKRHWMEQRYIRRDGSWLIKRLDTCDDIWRAISSGHRGQNTPSGCQMEDRLQSRLHPQSERSSQHWSAQEVWREKEGNILSKSHVFMKKATFATCILHKNVNTQTLSLSSWRRSLSSLGEYHRSLQSAIGKHMPIIIHTYILHWWCHEWVMI